MKRCGILSVLMVFGLLLAACAPATPQIIEKEVVVEKPVVQTVVVEKEVEKQVVQTVIVEKEVEKPVVQTVVVEKQVEVLVTPTPESTQPLRPQYGGTAIFTNGEGLAGPAGDFDNDTTFDWRYMDLYLDMLMAQKTDGTLEPRLATEITLAEDNLTWTVKMRTSAMWHDGEPIDADDLLYTLNTMCSGELSPPATLGEFAGIEGCQAYRDGEADTVAGLNRIDDYTVEIKTSQTNVALLYKLAGLHIVPEHFWKDVPLDKLLQHSRWTDQPVGSGPFKLTNYVSDLVVEFEANEDYYLGRPYLDKVIVRIAPADTAIAGLEAGEVDYVYSTTLLDIERLKTDPGYTIGVSLVPNYWGFFNHFSQEELRDPRIIQAINYAIDREGINEAVYGGYGNSDVRMWFKPGTWTANPDVPTYTYDPEKARQLFEEAGWDFDQHMEVLIWLSIPGKDTITEMVQANLADIGVNLDIYVMEESSSTEAWWNRREELWFTFAGIGGSYGNPYNFFPWFKTDSDKNWGWYMCASATSDQLAGMTAKEACGDWDYGSAELDELIGQALTTADQEAAQPIMWEIDRILNEFPPGIPILNRPLFQAWSSRLHGIQPSEEFDGRHWFHAEQWWIEQ